MMFSLFSVYDSAVGTYSPPIAYRSLGQAIRAFQQEARNPDSGIGRSLKDYTLFRVGAFDDSTGIPQGEAAPVAVLTALNAVEDNT